MKILATLLVTTAVLFSSCSSSEENIGANYIDLKDQDNISKVIGNEKLNFHIMSSNLSNKLMEQNKKRTSALLKEPSKNLTHLERVRTQLRSLEAPASTSSNDVVADLQTISDSNADNQLVVGFPIDGLNKKYLFGGVITKVAGTDSEDYGILKLSDLPALHVEAGVVDLEDDEYVFVLVGCFGPCTAQNEPGVLVKAPVLGVNNDETHAMIDLSGLGNELNLFEIIKGPDSADNPIQADTLSSKTIKSDFSDSTLIFDIETKIKTDQNENITIVGRWYIKDLDSLKAGDFIKREPNKNVGFFQNDLDEKYISRLPTTKDGATEKVKYYIKNVPEEFRGGFVAAINEWNTNFFNMSGEKLLDYEFLESGDPRNKFIVAGDIRYHVIEWDLVNLAPYGGFGPSISDYETGQIVSANVMVQGPVIVNLYKGWFKVEEDANLLASHGLTTAAATVRDNFANSIEKASTKKSFKLSMGNLEFNIKGQSPEYHDPLVAAEEVKKRMDFFDTPEGFDFDTYMLGYFQELVAHELGHNIGLRHNFRGNFGKQSDHAEGEVSSSVMEYLSRTERHLNRISSYDMMAVKFGYMGITPEVEGVFCTDENVPSARNPRLSAECSRNDLGTDPYGYFKQILQKAFDTVLNKSSDQASDWLVVQMKSEIQNATQGMAAYYSSAEDTSETWTNWNSDVSRPTSVREIKNYVLSDLKSIACDEEIAEVIQGKSEQADQEKVKGDIKEIKKRVIKHMGEFGLPTRAISNCD